MSEEPPIESLKPRRRRAGIGKVAVLTAAASIAGGTLAPAANAKKPPKPKNTPAEVKKLKQELAQKDKELKRASDIAKRLVGVSQSELQGKGLKRIEELPGYRHEISRQTRAVLINSTMQLLQRPKGMSIGFGPSCTATKVQYQGQSYVMSATHCFIRDAQVDFGMVDGWPAQNITNSTADEYGVALAGDRYPIGSVSAISLGMPDRSDITLMKIQPSTKGGDPSQSQFDQLPAVNLDKSHRPPQPGEQVGLFSDPGANQSRPVMDTGRYLGRTEVSFTDGLGVQRSYYLDLVGIDPRDPKGDACNYGSSGSMAISAGGYLFGPLSWRNGVGYRSGEQNYPDNTVFNEKSRIKHLEKYLGIDLSQFSTICGYQIIEHSSDPQQDSLQSLVGGFEHFAPVYVPSSGGPPFGGK